MSALFADPERTVVPMPQVLVEYLESQIPEQLRFTVAGNERFGDEHVVAELDRLRRSGFRGNGDHKLGDAGCPRGPHGMTGEKGISLFTWEYLVGLLVLVGLAGIEPATSALSVLRSNRLSYSPFLVRATFLL